MAVVARTPGVFLTVAGWVPNFADCEGVAGVDCVAAADGSALEILDPLVTASNLPDCRTLPSDHGAFVGLWAGAGPRGRGPARRPGREHLGHKPKVNFDGSAGFYAAGLADSGSDLVVALDAPQFDPAPNANPNRNRNCGRKVKMTRGRQSVDVTVTDRCMSCTFGDIDLSPAAFDQIATPNEGRVPTTWDFID